jgi:hypothetical protein
MAKFELKFLCTFGSGDFITCESQEQVDEEFNERWIKISTTREGVKSIICLDKSTSIKFAKTLRTEINKITDSEKIEIQRKDNLYL